MQRSRQFLLDSYCSMATVRRVEDRVHDEFSTGKIPGFVHLYAGEEASPGRRAPISTGAT